GGRRRCASAGPTRGGLLHEDRELDAAVLGATGRGLVGVDGLVHTRAARLDAALVDAVLDQVVLDRAGAARRQVLVVLRRAGAVGVARDLDADRRELLEHRDRAVEDRPRLRLDRVLVEVEVDALDRAGELGELRRDLVGAAVLVLVAVLGLGLRRALVVGIEDAV